jgi:Fe2+ transport system protein FeoA
MTAPRELPLHRLARHTPATISRVAPDDPGLLAHLASLGLLVPASVEVEAVSPFGGPLLVRVGPVRYALGRTVAAQIFVREP